MRPLVFDFGAEGWIAMLPDTISFQGPFALLPDGSGCWELAELGDAAGVYLFSIQVADAYRVFYVGQADRISARFRDHLAFYLSGRYWLYEPSALAQGKRVPAWEPQAQVEQTALLLGKHRQALEAMLPMVRIFFAPISNGKPALHRIESAIIRTLRSAPESCNFLENERLSVKPHDDLQKVRIRSDVPLFGIGHEVSA